MRGMAWERRQGDKVKAWSAEDDRGYYVEISLIWGELAAELTLYRRDPPALLATRTLNVDQIAMFAAHRDDLCEAYLDVLIAEVTR